MGWCVVWWCAARRGDPPGAEYLPEPGDADRPLGRLLPGAGLQHAAFACRDLPATCDQLAAVADHALPIPANYYDDLLARFGGELDVGQLQRRQLLYDRDPQGGAFLHLYTRPFIAGRFFFELTERRAGYALYGAANAAVRLAAMQYC